MIPKVIHYVWAGGAAKPAVVRACLASWRKHLRNYEIIEWNESNFNIDGHRYVREAYAARKWAFVSDYMRMQVVHQHGGIYLDSDCYVRGSLDAFRQHAFFTGFERDEFPFTAAFGATPHHPLVARVLQYYDAHPFLLPDGAHDTTTNTEIVGRIIREGWHCQPNGQYQQLADGVAIYPASKLCRFSRESVVVHLMSGTWEGKRVQERFLHRVFGGRAPAELFRVTHPYLFAGLTTTLKLAQCFRKRI